MGGGGGVRNASRERGHHGQNLLPFTFPEISAEATKIRNVKSRNNSDSNATATTIVESEGVRSAAAVINEKESEKFRLNIKTLKDCGIYE